VKAVGEVERERSRDDDPQHDVVVHPGSAATGS
jgi:hypothetical protein